MNKLTAGNVAFNLQEDGRIVMYVNDIPRPMRLEDGVLMIDMPSSPVPPVEPNDPKDEIDINDIIFLHKNISQWEITSKITEIAISFGDVGPVCVFHTKQGQWPEYGTDTIVEGNPWIFAKIDNQWYGATYEHNRPGQGCKRDVNRLTIGPLTKASPLKDWTPQHREEVGFCQAASSRYDPITVKERSNIKLFIWP